MLGMKLRVTLMVELILLQETTCANHMQLLASVHVGWAVEPG